MPASGGRLRSVGRPSGSACMLPRPLYNVSGWQTCAAPSNHRSYADVAPSTLSRSAPSREPEFRRPPGGWRAGARLVRADRLGTMTGAEGPGQEVQQVDFDETFVGMDLDPAIWTTSYLPAWSSRAESAATYSVADGQLTLSIPPDQGLWCEDLHQS